MEIVGRNHLGAYQLFLAADVTVALGMGLFAPFWIVFIQDFGDSSSALGFAVGIKILAYSFAAYIAGAVSDKSGRRAPIIAGRLASSLIIFSYPWINSLSQLYALQALFGIAAAVDSTATAAFLGDITKRASRGRDIGRFVGITGIVGAVAMMAGGVVVDRFGIEFIFYAVGALFCVSSLLLFFITEEKEVV